MSQVEYKPVLIVLIISLLVGAGAGYVFGQSQIAGYKEEIDGQERENLELQGQQSKLQEDFDAIQYQLESAMTNLSSNYEELVGAYNALILNYNALVELSLNYSTLIETYNEQTLNYNALIGVYNGLAREDVFMSYWTPTPPKIDGFAEEGEWLTFRNLTLSYEGTFNSVPWDKTDKNARISIMRDGLHLYLCIVIPDDYISQEFKIDALFIYLDDGSEIIDNRQMLWDTKKSYPRNSWVIDEFTNRSSGEHDYDSSVGGTIDLIGQYTHTSGGSLGAKGNYTIELDLPLRAATGDIYDADAPPGEVIDVEISFAEVKEWTEEGFFDGSSHWKSILSIIG